MVLAGNGIYSIIVGVPLKQNIAESEKIGVRHTVVLKNDGAIDLRKSPVKRATGPKLAAEICI
jgi:hypothetical protein